MPKGGLHPGDSKFHWIDKITGQKMSSLWVNTSNDKHIRDGSFKYSIAEHIQDDIHSRVLLNSVQGFPMSRFRKSVDDIPTRDSILGPTGTKRVALFSGCSNTYGTGLEPGERWVDHVYNSLNVNNEYSGLFNLGQAGDSFQTQVGYIFEYCKKYGIPNEIFFNVPDFWRILIENDVYKIYAGDHLEYSQDSLANILIGINRHYYSILENFCIINNISLIAFSWDEVTNNWLHDFETFIPIDSNYLQEKIFSYTNGSEFEIRARDDLHPGTATHKAWAEIVLNTYATLT